MALYQGEGARTFVVKALAAASRDQRRHHRTPGGSESRAFDAFRAQLSQAAVLVQGSGWGALAFEPLGSRLIVEQIYDHHANLAQGSVPLLVFDVWEHAYYLQYRN